MQMSLSPVPTRGQKSTLDHLQRYLGELTDAIRGNEMDKVKLSLALNQAAGWVKKHHVTNM